MISYFEPYFCNKLFLELKGLIKDQSGKFGERQILTKIRTAKRLYKAEEPPSAVFPKIRGTPIMPIETIS